MEADFELLTEANDIEAIAVNLSIRERKSLRTRFGGRHWRKLKGVALVRFPNGEVHRAELHWYEAHGVGRRKMKVKADTGLKAMSKSKKRVTFAICVADEGYDDLEVWKVYQVLPDGKAAGVGCVRVIDESGEDYLYPADRFVAVDFPSHVRARLPRWQPSHRPNSAPQEAVKSRRRLSA